MKNRLAINIISVITALIVVSFTPRAIADELNECINYTEKVWGTPYALLMAVHEVEGGKPGKIAWNKNKTIDMGPLQFNSATVADLKKYGVTEAQMRDSECASFYVAGWKLSTSARKHGDWRLAIAAYNCGDGCVSRAVKKLNSAVIDVSALDIPPKTKTDYVPRVMSAWRRHTNR